MRLDTLKTMERALNIYFKFGFYKIEPYYNNPHNDVVYLEKIAVTNHIIGSVFIVSSIVIISQKMKENN